MDLQTANQCVKWFEDLYPAATVPQLVALRSELLSFREANFRASAAAAVTRKSFVNDAIIYVMEQLRVAEPSERRDGWEERLLRTSRAEVEALEAQRLADDTTIDAASLADVAAACRQVLDGFDDTDIDRLLKRGCERLGMQHRYLRGRVAQILRSR